MLTTINKNDLGRPIEPVHIVKIYKTLGFAYRMILGFVG